MYHEDRSIMEFPSLWNDSQTHNFTNGSNFHYITDDAMKDDGYGLADEVQISLVCLYAVTVVLSIGGNTLVVYVVFSLQRLRNVTNFYIVNLSCSDIIVTSLCIPFTVVSNLIYYYWPFGPFLCPFVMYLQLTAVLQRAMTLVAMTLDRHYAIWKPFKRRCSKREAKYAIGFIWVTSAVLSLPTALTTRIIYLPYEPGNMGLCTEEWTSQVSRYTYSISILLLQYFIPLFIMCVTYVHIGIIIWVKRPPGEADNNRDVRLAATKKKTVKMLIVVVTTYALCWLPLHVITILGDVNPGIYDHTYVHTLWMFIHWLAISNSCTNPIIYFCMNNAFHQGFVLVVRAVFCRGNSGFLRRLSANTTGSTRSNKQSNRNNNDNEPLKLENLARYA